jgi:hypothetical protein
MGAVAPRVRVLTCRNAERASQPIMGHARPAARGQPSQVLAMRTAADLRPHGVVCFRGEDRRVGM